jgi:hypothetical protein
MIPEAEEAIKAEAEVEETIIDTGETPRTITEGDQRI